MPGPASHWDAQGRGVLIKCQHRGRGWRHRILRSHLVLLPHLGCPSTHCQQTSAFSSFFSSHFAAHEAIPQHPPAYRVAHLLQGRVEAQLFLQPLLEKEGIEGSAMAMEPGRMEPRGALTPPASLPSTAGDHALTQRDRVHWSSGSGARCAHGRTISLSGAVWSWRVGSRPPASWRFPWSGVRRGTADRT